MNKQEVHQLMAYCKTNLDLGHIELGAEYRYGNLAISAGAVTCRHPNFNGDRSNNLGY